MVKEESVRRITGACELARQAGCSRTMIYKVARGQATSARIAELLAAHGITVPPPRRLKKGPPKRVKSVTR